ncbi:hypothetical protein L1R71_27265 [Klebsiella pneumoniae]
MKPARVTRKQMKELVSQLNGILDHIDNGMDENNEELKQMMGKRRLSTVWQILKFLRG